MNATLGVDARRHARYCFRMEQGRSEALIIPYGAAAIADGMPSVMIDRAGPLRLSDGSYPFPEPPDLIRLTTVAERMDLLRELLQSLCALWDRPTRLFLEFYFRWVAVEIADHAEPLAALAAQSGGLFAPEDWSFSALRPLPQAHLPLGEGASVRVDFAFWTGAELVALELRGAATLRRRRRDELARLAQTGVTLIEVPAGQMEQQGEALLASLLPPCFHHFSEGVLFPASPFAPQGLGAIISEARR